MEVPTRSYTLEAAITPPPEVPVPSAPCPKEDKKSEPQPQPTSTQTRTQPSPRAPRGRPRKNASRHSESLSIPKYRTDTSTSPPHTLHSQTLPSLPVSACSSMPHPAPTLSMDEIPVPDAESKPGQAVFKLTPSSIPGVTSGLSGAGAAAGKEGKKKPIMACLFCRERKIACGPPAPGSPNPRCKYVFGSSFHSFVVFHDLIVYPSQCVRRGLECEYPKESRRGQHKRGPRAVRVQALTEEREQNASCSAPSSSASPAGHGSATSKSSQSGDSPSSNSVSSSSGASIKAGIKRKEKLVVNGKSSSKAKGKSPVKKEEGEMEASIRRA